MSSGENSIDTRIPEKIQIHGKIPTFILDYIFHCLMHIDLKEPTFERIPMRSSRKMQFDALPTDSGICYVYNGLSIDKIFKVQTLKFLNIHILTYYIYSRRLTPRSSSGRWIRARMRWTRSWAAGTDTRLPFGWMRRTGQKYKLTLRTYI